MKKNNKVNVNEMSEEELSKTIDTVSEKINSILLKDKQKINKMLNLYGLEIDLGFEIKQKI